MRSHSFAKVKMASPSLLCLSRIVRWPGTRPPRNERPLSLVLVPFGELWGYVIKLLHRVCSFGGASSTEKSSGPHIKEEQFDMMDWNKSNILPRAAISVRVFNHTSFVHTLK